MGVVSIILGGLLLAGCSHAQSPIITPLDPFAFSFAVMARVTSSVLLNDCTLLKNTFRLNYDAVAADAARDLAKIEISIYKTNSQMDFELVSANVSLALSTSFDKTLPTVVYVHGFVMADRISGISQVTQALLKKGGMNVLVLDRKAAIQVEYVKASTYTRYLGNMLGSVLNDLVTVGVSEAKLHLVGHGLGAHVSGFAGKRFKALSGKTLGRITALDAAGACFHQEPSDRRLDKTDASFVDVIHTDGGTFGITKDIGTADFYPSGGENQPFPLNNIPLVNHMRSWEIFAESVRYPKAFPGVSCASYIDFLMGGCSSNPTALMGYAASNPPAEGRFYMKTGPIIAYGIGDAGVSSWPFGPIAETVAWGARVAEVVGKK